MSYEYAWKRITTGVVNIIIIESKFVKMLISIKVSVNQLTVDYFKIT